MELTKKRKLDNCTAEQNTKSSDYIELQMVTESPILSTADTCNDEVTSSNVLNPRIAQVDDTYQVPSLLEEEDTHELQISFDVEEEAPDKTVGRRIVAVSNFFTKLQSICNHGPLGCGIQEMQLVGEVKHGLTSKFMFRCQLCKKKFAILSDEYGENYFFLPIRNPIQNEDKENHKPDDKIGQDIASSSICLSTPNFSDPVDNQEPICTKYLNFDSY